MKSLLGLFIFMSTTAQAQNASVVDRVKITGNDKVIYIFSIDPKTEKITLITPASDFAKPEDRTDEGAEAFNKRMAELFKTKEDKKLLDRFLSMHKVSGGKVSFTSTQFYSFIENLSSPACANAKKIFNDRSTTTEKQIADLKKKIKELEVDQESNASLMVGTCVSAPEHSNKKLPPPSAGR